MRWLPARDFKKCFCAIMLLDMSLITQTPSKIPLRITWLIWFTLNWISLDAFHCDQGFYFLYCIKSPLFFGIRIEGRNQLSVQVNCDCKFLEESMFFELIFMVVVDRYLVLQSLSSPKLIEKCCNAEFFFLLKIIFQIQ